MLAGLMVSDRAATVLNVLVDEYHQSATSVVSNGIARGLALKISSATASNNAARITGGGYISRPHGSSGSIPFDLGYGIKVLRGTLDRYAKPDD